MALNAGQISLNKLKISFCNKPLLDVPGAVAAEMEKLRPRVRKDMRIAVAAGSRGINNIAVIVKAVVDGLVSFGARPFVIPAMGSHGGATAEGQKEMLAGYGITDETMGVPVLSSMAAERVGELTDGTKLPVFMDRHAFEADGVVVVNRVKAHTDFHGVNESGIAKMLVIGLGKQAQATVIHEHMVRGLRELIRPAAETVIKTGKILGALAVVEDGYDQTSLVKAVGAESIVEEDSKLLALSKEMMPKLPWKTLDVLMVDLMGKDISGTGMDTNVIGRMCIRGEPDGRPDITRICLFGLTPRSHGNALGVGMADVIPQSLYDSIDWKATYENVLTSTFLERGFVPIVRPTDREVLDTALRTCGSLDLSKLRLLRIRDTLHIDEVYATPVLCAEMEGRDDVTVVERDLPLDFSDKGELKKL
ncbi:MAG: nickel-dependent lactate racemase [Synergistaceae bacterium]|nr:nickel-dependent lactate racemase [Synergistaceae bacterium]